MAPCSWSSLSSPCLQRDDSLREAAEAAKKEQEEGRQDSAGPESRRERKRRLRRERYGNFFGVAVVVRPCGGGAPFGREGNVVCRAQVQVQVQIL